MSKLLTICLLFSVGLILLRCHPVQKKPGLPGKAVEIRLHEGQWQLYRHGKPYYVKGVCTQDSRYLRALKECGGNSVRIYSTAYAKEILDSAQALGLTVMLGLDLLPAGPDMDYTDDNAVSRQFNRIREEVLRFRDHPALLMWSIGNEVGLQLSPANFFAESRLWIHVNSIARMIHELDPEHPATSAIESAGKLLYARAFCGNLDLISINSYRALSSVQRRITQFGWGKPYIISEYGPGGYWFADRTDWYTYLEPTSNQKRRFIIEQYQAIRSDSNRCMGSYAFYWGQKNECTPTYLSLFTPSGLKTELIDGLQYCWTGKWPGRRAPTLVSVAINNQASTEDIYLGSGKKYTASFIGAGAHTGLVLHWIIEKDDGELYFDPTMNQETRQIISKGSVPLSDGAKSDQPATPEGIRKQFEFQAPFETGPYRIYLYLEHAGKTATANACFYVFD